MKRNTLYVFIAVFFVCSMNESAALAGDLNQIKGKPYTVVVDYTRSLDQMVSAGRYDWYNDYITAKHVAVKGKGKAEVKLYLVPINQKATTKEVETYLDSLGLKSAKVEYLLALGEKFPELQRKYPIVALVSTWKLSDGARYVTFLDEDGYKRHLGLNYILPTDQWEDNCRFLAVSK